jgi:U3 small nucleolar RNA-associated protein 13
VGAVAIASRKSTYDSNTAFIITGGGDKVLKRWKFPKEILLKPQSSLTNESSEEKKQLIIELQATHSIRAHDKDINAIAVAPNDAIIATGSQDR